jgi:hypothetical protein
VNLGEPINYKEMPKKTWTLEDILILKKHYPYMSTRSLEAILPGKTRQGICAKAHNLGISKNKQVHDNELDKILNQWQVKNDRVFNTNKPAVAESV